MSKVYDADVHKKIYVEENIDLILFTAIFFVKLFVEYLSRKFHFIAAMP